MLLRFNIEPVPAARPRVTRQGWSYYPKKYKEYKAKLGELVKEYAARPRTVSEDHDPTSPLTVHMTIMCSRPKTTKLSMPKPDVDNYAKGVLDACNGVLWTDDSLVGTLVVSKRWAKDDEPAGIVMTVSKTGDY